jgi:hypothetical protein
MTAVFYISVNGHHKHAYGHQSVFGCLEEQHSDYTNLLSYSLMIT